MKILEPFSGYKLASGHPLFHLALFVGSWFVDGDASKTWANEKARLSVQAFLMVRWAHLAIFLLNFPHILVSWLLKIKADKENKDAEEAKRLEENKD